MQIQNRYKVGKPRWTAFNFFSEVYGLYEPRSAPQSPSRRHQRAHSHCPHLHVREGMIGKKDISSYEWPIHISNIWIGYSLHATHHFSPLALPILWYPPLSHSIHASHPPPLSHGSRRKWLRWRLPPQGPEQCPDPGMLILLLQPWW
jgi:hypothetical protein